MSWVLISLFIIAFIVAITFWYYTRDYRSIPDDRIIDLATAENRILDQWYDYHLKPTINLDSNDKEITARFLQRIYQIEVNPDLLVIGMDLDTKYFRLTGQHLKNSDQLNSNIDQVFDLRKAIGKSGQIAIIHNSMNRERIQRNITYDTNEIRTIMDQKLDLIARDYLQEVLKYRWNKIMELNDPHLINLDGTYVYLRKCQILNIETKEENGIHRINLLCTDLEFETLIQRWRKSLTEVSVI